MSIGIDDYLVRLTLAAICGLVVGIDREMKRKPLGARSYMLVSVASAAWTMFTLQVSLDLIEQDPQLGVDPTRLIQGLVGAIGFLGAGAIISTTETGRLRGVASGAAIWGMGAVGLACGMGYFEQAGALAITIAGVLTAYDLITRDDD